MSNKITLDFETRSAAELGTQWHKAIEDCHIGMMNDRGNYEITNRQTATYAAGFGFDEIMVISGGDLIHGEVNNRGFDTIMVIDGEPTLVDYKLSRMDYSDIEKRLVKVMRENEMDALLGKVALNARDIEEPSVKPSPTRGPKRRDWEQRNKKRRR